MSIKYFNDGFGMSPEDYAKALFENTIDNKLTLSRRNEDPLVRFCGKSSRNWRCF
jgi:hypothetical protein